MNRGAKRWLLIAVFAVIALSPLLAWLTRSHPRVLDRYDLSILVDMAINVILAVSLNLINGHTGQFSLGHAGFMAVGGFTAARLTLTLQNQVPPWAQPALFIVALVLGGLLAALAGLAVGVPSLRLRGDYLAIVTLGFGEIIRVFFQTTEVFGAATGLAGIPNWTNFAWAWAVAALTVFVVTALVNSTYGRGFIAVHDDEVAAGATGVNPVRFKVTAFVVGAFFAGMAGALYAHHKPAINPSGFDFMKSIDIVVMVILGGMGRTPGVIIAAILLTLLPEWLRRLPSFTVDLPWSGLTRIQLTDFRMIIYSLLIIWLMLLRPQGLFTWPLFGNRARQ